MIDLNLASETGRTATCPELSTILSVGVDFNESHDLQAKFIKLHIATSIPLSVFPSYKKATKYELNSKSVATK